MTDNQQEQSRLHDLVVIGSSAGGVEALGVLVSTLPADFSAPIVVAQHLDPNRSTSLPDILQRRTSLQVGLVDGTVKLEPGTIYLVPNNRHLAINDGHVELVADHKDRPRPSIDLLLSTAAAAYGDRLIAVILTGAGSDGAQGAIDVKGAGGTVIVQNPQTARYPSMPLSLPPSIVDFETDLERVGPLLQALVAGIAPAADEKPDDVLREILELVTRQTNRNFRSYKPATILRRISRRMTAVGTRSMREYARVLSDHPAEVGALVSALLINVTQFFRDGGAWEALRTTVLPDLIARNRAAGRTLRFWTAGCATGEEPYSLAILLADMLGAELGEWNIKIFATDVDHQAVAFARSGVYPANVLERLPDGYRDRFFERANNAYRIVKTLRQMVIFGEQDLSRAAPFPRIDLVLCRNVLIYFTPELQEYVLNQFTFSLSPHRGYLVLGKAETVRAAQTHYEQRDKQWRVYQCTSNRIVRHQALFGHTPQVEQRVPRTGGHASAPAGNALETLSVPDSNQLSQINDLLLRFLPTGVVVIDRAYRILTINAVARRRLGVRNAGADQDFLHGVRGIPYADVRRAIDAVFRERASVTLPEIDLDASSGGTGHFISLTVALTQSEQPVPDIAVISVMDVTEQVQNRRALETARTEQTQLVSELSTANQRLTEANKELLDSNEELQVANETLVLTHEELQATLEEFETTNEELQATNEELETSNEELQATNEELQTTNEELRARSVELQEVTDLAESERARLAEMVQLAPFSIMVLRGPELLVEAFNERYGWMQAGQVVEGEPLAHVVEHFWHAGTPIADLARDVYEQNAPRTTPRVLTRVAMPHGTLSEAYFQYTLVPTHAADGHVNGVVIYASDVTDQRAREAQAELQRLQLIFEHAEQVALALYDAHSAKLLTASPRYLQVVQQMDHSQPQDVIGSEWHNLECVVPLDDSIQQWNYTLETRETLRIPEIRAPHAVNGADTVWDWSLTPILDVEGEVHYMLVSAVEITDQVRAREEIERLDRLKDEFFSVASHELRTPMTPLMGFADMLARSIGQGTDGDDARIGRMVTSMQGQLRRLNRLIEDLLDVARLQSGKFMLEQEAVSLAELLEQVIAEARIQSPERTIELGLLLPNEPPLVVLGDDMRLHQVLLNLVQNAIKHASTSPRIDLQLRRVHDAARNEDMAEIAVQDYGQGIAPDDLPTVFDRFSQGTHSPRVARNGLGLGLYVAKQLVEQHNGTIVVESVVGAGSTFTVRLPLAPISVAPGAQKHAVPS